MAGIIRRACVAGGAAAVFMAGSGSAQGPTPEECANGATPVTLGEKLGQVVVCVGAGGQIVAYAGGDAAAVCGVVIAGNHPIQGNRVKDPQWCFEPVSVGHGTRGRWFEPAVRSRHGVVAAGSEVAARIGARVLEQGGNAIDAAVATTFAMGVTRPEMCGIGGAGQMVYRAANGKVAALDYQGMMPGASHPGMYDARGLHEAEMGHRMTSVPGVVAGLEAALERFGTIGLADAIAPAERLARRGFEVSEQLEWAYAMAETIPGVGDVPYSPTARLRAYPASARAYLPGGLPPTAGSRLRFPDYAQTLRRIAREGSEAFYRGKIADLIVAEMERSQLLPTESDRGLITHEDLAAYEAIWRDPVRGSYHGAEIIGAPAPSVGGTFVIETLNLLSGFELGPHSSADNLHLLAEAQKIAWADRTKYIGDPAHVEVPTQMLIDPAYADRRRAEISMTKAGTFGPGELGPEHGHTIHMSVVDANGNAVAMTCTMGAVFGNSVVVPGTGMLLNTQNTSGAEPDPHLPHLRARTSMSPTIVAKGGKPILAVGGAGSTLIPMGVVQAIVNVVDHGMGVAEAIDAARVSEPECCAMMLEGARVPPGVIADLGRRGHEVTDVGEYFPLPILAAVGWDAAAKTWAGADDSRGEYGPAAARRSADPE